MRTVHGGGKIGQALCEAPGVGKIFFTGSVEVGRTVGEICARNMKGSVLELGGKDPQIVCADADLDNAISGCVWGGFANAGQTCSGIERTYVVEEVADRFLAGVVRETERLTVGDPAGWETEIGRWSRRSSSSSSPSSSTTRSPRRRAAHRRPARGRRLRRRFIAPTVLAGVSDEMRIMSEEIFGPVLPIVVVGSEEEALERANDSNFGLGASVWTKDRAKGERIARQIESGMVWINDHSYTHAAMQCAWGGVKDSGLGRSHSKFGLYECVELKTSPGSRASPATSGGSPTTRRLGTRCAPPRSCSTAAAASE